MNRNEFNQLLAPRGLLGIAIEVGVYDGSYAEQILTWGVEHLHLVDLWRHVPGGKAELAESDQQLQSVFERCIERLRRFEDRITIHRGFSTEMSSHIEDGSCDFIHIDASHDEMSCRADLDVYWPKLRAGGIMSGHDYSLQNPGVITAVNSFTAHHHVNLHLCPVTENDVSYWFAKERS